MNRLIKHTAFNMVLVVLLGSLATGCSITKKHEKEAQLKADKEGLSMVKDSKFDGTFVAPNAQFAQYKKLFVEQLDMADVRIRKQSGNNFVNDTPWELNDRDRRYYQERYTEALMNNLIVDGRYSTAMQAATDVMTVRARVLEIAPLGSKDDSKGRPTSMKVYSEGMGTMTLEISLYDSVSGKVLGIITDQRDLGKMWEENNRVTNNVQVRLAFDAWLKKLRSELDRLSQ